MRWVAAHTRNEGTTAADTTLYKCFIFDEFGHCLNYLLVFGVVLCNLRYTRDLALFREYLAFIVFI